MGEIAEMMLDGTLDSETGEFLDGESPGFPRTMADVEANRRKAASYPILWGCSACQRKFGTRAAAALHIFDKHDGPKPTRIGRK